MFSRCDPDGAAGHRNRPVHPSISTSVVKKRTSIVSQLVGAAVLTLSSTATMLAADSHSNPLSSHSQVLRRRTCEPTALRALPRSAIQTQDRSALKGLAKLPRQNVERNPTLKAHTPRRLLTHPAMPQHRAPSQSPHCPCDAERRNHLVSDGYRWSRRHALSQGRREINARACQSKCPTPPPNISPWNTPEYVAKRRQPVQQCAL